MESLESHTYLIVDLGTPSSPDHPTHTLHAMWNAIETFFTNPSRSEVAPPMEYVADAGSRHAVYGYATYDNDAMQFLETRRVRSSSTSEEEEENKSRTVVPKELESLIGASNLEHVMEAFDVIASIGKDISTIATAAATQEANAYTPNYQEEDAFVYAQQMMDDLLDDGNRHFSGNVDLDTTVSMSPHRMCRYFAATESPAEGSSMEQDKETEVFGAHTDTSFVTVIPVAAVAGLEVFDDDAREWVRPEAIARQHWEDHYAEQQNNSEEDPHPPNISWNSRYLVVMAGELLQLTTRSMIPSAVHRVVAATGGTPRLSAPVLLRARMKMTMDLGRYFGEEGGEGVDVLGKALLSDCDALTMEEIHDALQP